MKPHLWHFHIMGLSDKQRIKLLANKCLQSEGLSEIHGFTSFCSASSRKQPKNLVNQVCYLLIEHSKYILPPNISVGINYLKLQGDPSSSLKGVVEKQRTLSLRIYFYHHFYKKLPSHNWCNWDILHYTACCLHTCLTLSLRFLGFSVL